LLAQDLSELHGREDVFVLGLPRGGIPVAYEVALALEAPLDSYIVRKLGVPGHEELAMGAIATGNVQILNRDIIVQEGVSDGALATVVAREKRELYRRERLYRGTQPPPDLSGRTVVLVDDGLATGATMRAAVLAVHQLGPRGVIVAVPVAAPR
jgi:putative phosphoribosyl transferase